MIFSDVLNLCFRLLSKLMRSRMCLVEQGKESHFTLSYEAAEILTQSFIHKNTVYSTIFSFLHSGGVMIYFDRIEVVNMLVPTAGRKML